MDTPRYDAMTTLSDYSFIRKIFNIHMFPQGRHGDDINYMVEQALDNGVY